ncbi:hypothetical protein LTR99_009785, partial [Exophiala xenobiotica]|nr:hypothetical protein H2202_010743 [Exophiala xenobiotica]KAK5529354.1 hypothetical protein LTR23_010696 [Chaetothyriales sp. CCFEE 6169]KAK5192462.1 hypothetical protein LTR92_007637 [Exophiala xenobiotica]KAK5207524.1 hypothetical protein LTR41_006568 [Exophiala xenobiotica]KAK5220550.1 hypothetical protein LTR72_007172 [Exophiala xenobiotica]
MSSSTGSASTSSSTSSTGTITPNTSSSSGHDNLPIVKSWTGNICRSELSRASIAEKLLRRQELKIEKRYGGYLMRLAVGTTSSRALTACGYQLDLLGTTDDNTNNADIPSLLGEIQNAKLDLSEILRIFWSAWAQNPEKDLRALLVLAEQAAEDVIDVVFEDVRRKLG